jgi:hypothetical protein
LVKGIERKREAWGGLGFCSNANKRPEEVSALLTAMRQQEPFPSEGQLSSRSHTSCHLAKVSLEGLLNPLNRERERERERERDM